MRTHEHQSADKGAMAFLAVLTALALVMGTMVPAAFADSVFASGTGTTEDPFVIQTVDQLKAFGESVNSGTTYENQTVKLAADLDISGSDWTPIGAGARTGNTDTSGTTPFKGTFDGNNHTITGLTISATTPLASNADNALGLFGVLDGAFVSNLTLTDVNINVPTSKLAGGLAGLAIDDSVINNVHVAGSITGAAGLGGVIGRMTFSGAIVDCTNDATVAGTGGNIGGIVGAAYYTEPSAQMRLTGNKNTGNVSGGEAVGGISGLNSAFVSFNTNTGAVTATGYGAGGIVGDQHNYGAIEWNHNSGEVTITTSDTSIYGCGGIVGWVRYNGLEKDYQTSAPIDVTGNTNTAAIHGANDAGGIVGTMYSAGTVSGNTNEAPAITAITFAGGIVGNLQQEGGDLPSTIKEGIAVEDNVSTTPLESIEGTNKDLFAYDNSPDKFIVANNSTTLKQTPSATDPDTTDQPSKTDEPSTTDQPGVTDEPDTTGTTTKPDTSDSTDDPTQAPTTTDTDNGPTTAPAVGSPSDEAATQQAGTADPTSAADNATQTGASLQQTGDDLGRVAGVLAVVLVTAGLTALLIRKRS